MDKFCKRCKTNTKRYMNGRCKPCKKILDAAYYTSNVNKIKAYKVAYRVANRQKVKECNTAWRKANSEKYKKSLAKYRMTHSEAYRIYDQNRNARKHENGGVLSSGLAKKLFKQQNGRCPCCGNPLGDNYHIDHIMPIALGGANKDTNIQLLRATCNHQKSVKHPIDFMQGRGFLL